MHTVDAMILSGRPLATILRALTADPTLRDAPAGESYFADALVGPGEARLSDEAAIGAAARAIGSASQSLRALG